MSSLTACATQIDRDRMRVIRSHVRAERALTAGPWHQPWPFVCPFCSQTFQTDSGWFPYCGAHCAIDAQGDR
jgi:hypothetical protein